MHHAIEFNQGGALRFEDDRDADQLAEALVAKGYIKINGPFERAGNRTVSGSRIVFREHVVAITS